MAQKFAVIVAIFLGISLFLAIPFMCLQYSYRDYDFYINEFTKNNIYNDFKIWDIEKEEIDRNAIELIDYLSDKKSNLDNTYYNSREKAHLADVKRLLKISEITLFACVMTELSCTVMLIYMKKNVLSSLAIFYASLGEMIAIALFTILTQIGFRWVFIKFHEMLFNNDLWLLDPTTDKLIVMLPRRFFMDITIKMVVMALVISALLMIVELIAKKIMKKRITK